MYTFFCFFFCEQKKQKKVPKKKKKRRTVFYVLISFGRFSFSAKAESLMLAIALRARSQIAEHCLSEASLRGLCRLG